MMTLAEYSMTAFALLNGGRAFAYIPQMIRVYRDPHRAAAVSVTTWTLFTAANVATIFYAVTVYRDFVMASIFGLNALGCSLIVGMILIRRVSRSPLPKTASLSDEVAAIAPTSGAPLVGPVAHSIAKWSRRCHASRRYRLQWTIRGGLAAID